MENFLNSNFFSSIYLFARLDSVSFPSDSFPVSLENGVACIAVKIRLYFLVIVTKTSEINWNVSAESVRKTAGIYTKAACTTRLNEDVGPSLYLNTVYRRIVNYKFCAKSALFVVLPIERHYDLPIDRHYVRYLTVKCSLCLHAHILLIQIMFQMRYWLGLREHCKDLIKNGIRLSLFQVQKIEGLMNHQNYTLVTPFSKELQLAFYQHHHRMNSHFYV